jgi:hypothetical protein
MGEERAVSRKVRVEGCEDDGKVQHGKWHYLFILLRGWKARVWRLRFVDRRRFRTGQCNDKHSQCNDKHMGKIKRTISTWGIIWLTLSTGL